MNKLNYKHPKYKEIERECQNRFDHDFNYISHEVVKKVFDDCDFENVIEPSMEIIIKEWLDSITDEEELQREFCNDTGITDEYKQSYEAEFYKWLEENRYDDIREHWHETEHYPMWGTLFEAKDECLSRLLLKNVDELYNIGIGVMDGGDYFKALLFIAGAGYDFYNHHWIPMYTDVLDWVKA